MRKVSVAAKSKISTCVASHPPYFEMIRDAISTMNDRTGSSQQSISKFIEDKYKRVLPSNFKKVLSSQLKKFVKSEKLLKVKNSYKISPTEKLKTVREDPKKKDPEQKGDVAKKISKKGVVKTKKLSQVKTPERMKMATKGAKKKPMKVGERMKKLSQIKTPDVFKKKIPTPMSRRRKDLK